MDNLKKFNYKAQLKLKSQIFSYKMAFNQIKRIIQRKQWGNQFKALNKLKVNLKYQQQLQQNAQNTNCLKLVSILKLYVLKNYQISFFKLKEKSLEFSLKAKYRKLLKEQIKVYKLQKNQHTRELPQVPDIFAKQQNIKFEQKFNINTLQIGNSFQIEFQQKAKQQRNQKMQKLIYFCHKLEKIIQIKQYKYKSFSFYALINHQHHQAFDSHAIFLRLLQIMDKQATLQMSKALNKWRQNVQIFKTEYYITQKLLKKESLKSKKYPIRSQNLKQKREKQKRKRKRRKSQMNHKFNRNQVFYKSKFQQEKEKKRRYSNSLNYSEQDLTQYKDELKEIDQNQRQFQELIDCFPKFQKFHKKTKSYIYIKDDNNDYFTNSNAKENQENIDDYKLHKQKTNPYVKLTYEDQSQNSSSIYQNVDKDRTKVKKSQSISNNPLLTKILKRNPKLKKYCRKRHNKKQKENSTSLFHQPNKKYRQTNVKSLKTQIKQIIKKNTKKHNKNKPKSLIIQQKLIEEYFSFDKDQDLDNQQVTRNAQKDKRYFNKKSQEFRKKKRSNIIQLQENHLCHLYNLGTLISYYNYLLAKIKLISNQKMQRKKTKNTSVKTNKKFIQKSKQQEKTIYQTALTINSNCLNRLRQKF